MTMPGTILSGKEVADSIKADVKERVKSLAEQGIPLKLTAVQVGENASSAVYLNAQKKNCTAAGISHELQQLPASTDAGSLARHIRGLNEDPSVHGIILQMPLPQGLDAGAFQAMIAPAKDVEGVNPENMGRIVYGKPRLAPCTAMAVTRLIEKTGVDPDGKEMVVVGHSDIVGKPVALLWLSRFATVSVCHVGTAKRGMLESHVKRAEILVVAVGKAGVVPGSWVREGAIVVDVGINRVGDTIVGDVEYEAAKERASWITPVPGGVGPVTTAILLHNVTEAARWQMSA
jgi:methylenetetrahydrofolate dehydrogenase (NADP+)/methenyltetrahydrofolate cyclohydrolase